MGRQRHRCLLVCFQKWLKIIGRIEVILTGLIDHTDSIAIIFFGRHPFINLPDHKATQGLIKSRFIFEKEKAFIVDTTYIATKRGLIIFLFIHAKIIAYSLVTPTPILSEQRTIRVHLCIRGSYPCPIITWC